MPKSNKPPKASIQMWTGSDSGPSILHTIYKSKLPKHPFLSISNSKGTEQKTHLIPLIAFIATWEKSQCTILVFFPPQFRAVFGWWSLWCGEVDANNVFGEIWNRSWIKYIQQLSLNQLCIFKFAYFTFQWWPQQTALATQVSATKTFGCRGWFSTIWWAWWSQWTTTGF